MDNFILFEGPGPFQLPSVQWANATKHSENAVTLTVYGFLQKRENGVLMARSTDPEAVSVQIVSWLARELGEKLLQAADRADRKGSDAAS